MSTTFALWSAADGRDRPCVILNLLNMTIFAPPELVDRVAYVPQLRLKDTVIEDMAFGLLREIGTSPLLPMFHNRPGVTVHYSRYDYVYGRTFDRTYELGLWLANRGLVDIAELGLATFKLSLTEKGALNTPSR